MAIQWADSFSRYGVQPNTVTPNSYMRDGLPYLNWEQPVHADPDPLAAAKGERAVYMRSSGGGDFYNYNYIALPTPITSGVIGVNCRMWFSFFGAGQKRNCIALFMDNSANFMAYVVTESNGAISLYAPGGSLLDSTVSPAVSTNSWNHFETKYNTATGLVEVYLNGIKRLEGTALTGTVTRVWIGSRFGATSSNGGYYKQLVIWDGTGSKNNDIMGTVVVGRKPPVGDVTLGGWVPSAGSTGYDLLADTSPANIFTASAQLDSDGTENIRIDNTYYRPVTGSVDAGAPAGTSANPWLFALGVDAAESLQNFFAAINDTGTPGTTYSTGLTAHPTVTAKGVDATKVLITSNDGITATYTCTETMTNAAWASSTMSLVGPQDLSYLSADDSPPLPMEFSLADLDDEVTSVKGIVAVVRARKIDGGDANLQTSLISDGDDAPGADRPITSAYTYWFDVSEIDPHTSTSWTPVSFNAATAKIDRTV